jgi:hypothetical protein
LGLKLNVAQSIDVRLISSYGNNNERYMSNPLKLTVTPFADPSVLTTLILQLPVRLPMLDYLLILFHGGLPFKAIPA